MSAPDRPTREAVDAVLWSADQECTEGTRVGILAVEVRALRAELAGLRKALDIRDRLIERAWDAIPDGLPVEDDSLATSICAALAARTPQPAERDQGVRDRMEELQRENARLIAELLAARDSAPQPAETVRVGDPCPWDGPDGVHEAGTGRDREECRYCDGTIAPSAPLPAVPDGPDPEGDEWFHDVAAAMNQEVSDASELTVSQVQAALRRAGMRLEVEVSAVPDGEDEPRHAVKCPSCSATTRARMADASDGEDVPARLDAAADALAAISPAWAITADWFRMAAEELREDAPSEVRAAVAAALALPTGGETNG